MTPRAVIIDTDPGLDDAIAILFALAHPGFDIRGITTVAGNIGLSVTTRNALRLLALAGRADIPVHPGASVPLWGEGLSEERIHGTDGLGGVSLPEPVSAPQTLPASDFTARALTEAPAGSLDIFALGPLTNIARLVQEASEASKRIGRLIVMGGAIEERGNVGPRSEFNLAHDPEAAQIVLRAGVPLTLVPLDVTRKVRADGAWLDQLGDSARARTVCALIEAYFAEGRESRPLHDPCVPVLATEPDLFGIETRRLAVDMDGDPGALVPGDTSVDVAMRVDAAGVLDRLAERLG